MNKLMVHIDFDGVLIPNYYEKRLIERLSGTLLDDKISCFHPDVFNWYVDMVNASPPPPLNVPLLRFFEEHSDRYTLRLWTNRNEGLVQKTKEDLGKFTSLFDSFEFYEGVKIDSKVEGVVIDNTPKYLKCGELGGIHYEWKGGDTYL